MKITLSANHEGKKKGRRGRKEKTDYRGRAWKENVFFSCWNSPKAEGIKPKQGKKKEEIENTTGHGRRAVRLRRLSVQVSGSRKKSWRASKNFVSSYPIRRRHERRTGKKKGQAALFAPVTPCYLPRQAGGKEKGKRKMKGRAKGFLLLWPYA